MWCFFLGGSVFWKSTDLGENRWFLKVGWLNLVVNTCSMLFDVFFYF